jgi:hypothetical protein
MQIYRKYTRNPAVPSVPLWKLPICQHICKLSLLYEHLGSGPLYWFSKATLTRYHSWVAYNNRNLSAHSS